MQDKIRRQLEAWRDSYINTSLSRNNMLNVDLSTTSAVRFIVNDYFTYENFWKIATGRGDYDEYAVRSSANTDPRYNPIAWEALRDTDNRNDISYLENLVKRGYDAIVQKGENPICLTFGCLSWRVTNPDAGEGDEAFTTVNTPLLLIPIKLNKRGVNFWVKPVDGDAMINPSLMLRYEMEGYKSLPLPKGGAWIDIDSFDIAEYFESVEEHFKGSATCKFDKDYVALDLFDYDRICMYRDVSRHMSDLENNKIIRAMFGEMNSAPVFTEGLDLIDPRRSFSILDTNSGQNEVIERFSKGESFVLEGPPGTGKTQTIVNMISDAIMNGRKVLFVSGKMSALHTVMKKLKMPGVSLDQHCLLIKGEMEDKKLDITDTYGKLQASYDAPRPILDQKAYEDNLYNLVESRLALVGYNHEFFQRSNPLEMSIYDIIGRMLTLGYTDNLLPGVAYGPAYISTLSKTTLRERTTSIAEIEKLVSAIINRSGAIEKDAWYGWRHTELTPKLEGDIKLAIAEIGSIKADLDRVLSRVTGESDEAMERLASVVLDAPLETLVTLFDGNVSRALGELYIKGSLKDEREALEAEILRSARYTAERDLFYKLTKGEMTAYPDELVSLVAGSENYTAFKITGIREELDKVTKMITRAESPIFKERSEDIPELETVIGLVDTLNTSSAEEEELKTELLASFTEDILTLEYLPLLTKFRTQWEKNLKEDKEPFLFGMAIAKLKKACRDAVSTDFSLRGTYDLLEKIDRYHRANEKRLETVGILSTYGISDAKASKQLDELVEYIKVYIDERMSHEIEGLLVEKVDFVEYLTTKKETLSRVDRCAKLIGLTHDITVGELRELIDSYKTVKYANERIAGDYTLTSLFGTGPKDVRTNFVGALSLVKIIERAKVELRDENRTIDEDFKYFAKTIELLASSGLQEISKRISEKYTAFYKNTSWFDPEIMGDSHASAALTYPEFKRWYECISDINTIAEYTSYRKKLTELDASAAMFFSAYAKAGRREYPIEKMRDNFEISLLHAFYVSLLSKSKHVSALSGNDGIHTLEATMERYAEADKLAIEFNRKQLDMRLYMSITRSASPVGNKHNYIRSIPRGSSISVRRLFKNRSDSIQELAPCIMMSVYSVSKLLEYGQYEFDTVIFDEASQIPAEDALTSIMRAKCQVVIAGDPKQMPAISYFKDKSGLSNLDADSESDMIGECPSIIDFIIRTKESALTYQRLDMHYRSNHESLVKYSNEHPKLYGGNLVTFPSPKARTRDFGLCDIDVTKLPEWENRTITGGGGKNEAEARVVIDLIKEHIAKYPLPKTEEEIEGYRSLGVIVFGTSQKKLIEDLIAKDSELSGYSMLGNEQVFAISTADEIQGDEMCEMIISLTYGRDADGNLSAVWGHMNQLPVALYKFNVAVTRAKDNLKFVHSVGSVDITNDNLSYVRDYLVGLEALDEKSFIDHSEYNTDFVRAIGAICEEIVGKDRVVYNYGESPRSYRVPISILSPLGDEVVLGVMCEVNRKEDGFSVREYGRTCQSILAAHGWGNLYNTYALQWIRNYAYEKRELIARLKAVL